jgi:hypothetical protein
MDKLPISTSFLMSINFEGLKEVIDFFHKNINILNEKINDLNKRFRGYEEIQNELKENKIKTESGLRLLGELEQSLNNYSQNIIQNTNNILTNKDNLSELKEEVEKIKLDNKNLQSNLNQINNKEGEINVVNNDNDGELKNEINKMKTENKENFEQLFNKIEKLEFKINKSNENKNKEKIININNKDINNDNKVENIQEKKDENVEDNIIYKELSKKINEIEEKINKISEEKPKEIILPNQNKVSEIKNISLSEKENKIEVEPEKQENNIPTENYDVKINKIENKIIKLENDIASLKLNNNININQNHDINIIPNGRIDDNILNNNLNDININNNIIKSEENKQKEEKENKNDNSKNDQINLEEIRKMKEEQQKKIDSLENKIIELMSNIQEINNKFISEKFIGNKDFIKFNQKIEVQLKAYNDKINDILAKQSLNDETLKRLSSINQRSSLDRGENRKSIVKPSNNQNVNSAELIESIESDFNSRIVRYLRNLDITNNPKILEIEKELENKANLINELNEKLLEKSKENDDKNKIYLEMLEKAKDEIKNDIKTIENKIVNIPLLRDDLEFCEGILFGREEGEKYKKMSKEEKNNEISLGASLKEEISIHGNYLKKLSEGINKVNNRINNLNKENLALIKKDLKNESNFILEDFKTGLKDSISKIENQLRDKVDKLGLDQFWNKINEQVIEEMKQKIDKKEMNKNNMYLKKKIDNLESKISRTFVDTLIDLQMDEAPLLVKKNFREITEQKCASCGQNIPVDKNNGLLGFSLDFNNSGTNQHKTLRQKNVADKDKLPEIKTNLQK